MQLIEQIKHSKPINSITVSPDRKQVIVAAGVDGRRTSAKKREHDLHFYRLKRGKLVHERNLFANNLPLRSKEERDTGFRYSHTQVAFRDNQSIAVARIADHTKDKIGECAEVLNVNLKSGKANSRFLDDQTPTLISGVVAVSPRRLLVGHAQAIVCLDASTLEETCRVPLFDADGEPIEDDVFGEESMAQHAFTWDGRKKLLYAMTGFYDAGVAYCFRLDGRRKQFERKWRRNVIEMRPKEHIDLPAARGVCLNPGGTGFTGIFDLEDLNLDLVGGPLGGPKAAVKAAKELRKAGRVAKLTTARLGWLGIFNESTDEWIQIESEIERDFDGGPCEWKDRGKPIKIGYQLATKQGWIAKPIYIDRHRILVVTPTGLMRAFDAKTGESTVEYDLRECVRPKAGEGPFVSALCFYAEKNQLFVGCASGELVVLECPVGRASRLPTLPKSQAGSLRHKQRVEHPKPKPRRKPPVASAVESFVLAPSASDDCVAITPDGRIAACGANVFDVKRQHSLLALDMRATRVSFSSDGKRFFVASDPIANMYEIATGRCLWSVKTGGFSFGDVVLSPDESLVATGDYTGKLSVWDVRTGKLLAELTVQSQPRRIAFNPNATLVVTALIDNTLRIWNIEAEKCEATLKGHKDEVTTVVWTPDGKFVISGSCDKTLRKWDIKTRKCVEVWKGHTSDIDDLAISRDGRTAVSGSADKTIRVWHLAKGERNKQTLRGLEGPVMGVAIGNGGRVISASLDSNFVSKCVHLWDISSGKCLGQVGERFPTGGPIAIAPEGGHLAIRGTGRIYTKNKKSCIDFSVQLWDINARIRVASFPYHDIPGWTIFFRSISTSRNPSLHCSSRWDVCVP